MDVLMVSGVRASCGISLVLIALMAGSGCSASDRAAGEVATTRPVSSSSALLSEPMLGVTDCLSGYSVGSIGDYAAGGGEASADEAIGFLTRAVSREWGSELRPETVAASDSKVVVEYLSDSRVVARGAVVAVGDKWQMEGLSQCTAGPAAEKSPASAADTSWPCFTELATKVTQGGRVVARPELVGLTVREARKAAPGGGAMGRRFRILGEDGECNDHHLDAYADRINVFVEDGRVIWAYNF
ncbi:hypothetical protein [Kineosporia sp. NBRC 101677]|uniref:hypothetical protein n=1 Tax=Kineosporia sp. NBRC 101677 TaxID=3032197 RepID=UPI00255421A2|nr:hypothetical protein [Kineosporia sp. NBRC 101677]